MTSEVIALIGFKHVGKSTVAKALAAALAYSLYDLDECLEHAFARQYDQALTCRQIMAQHGEAVFRQLESEVLRQIPLSLPSVVALGGGAPMNTENQWWLQQVTVVHVTAPADVVFTRIMAAGVPAFFSSSASPRVAFDQLWHNRQQTYHALADVSLMNDADLGSTLDQLLRQLALTALV